MASGRPKHQKKEVEAVLAEAEQHDWTFERSKKRYQGKCGCADKHMKWVALTPSGANYAMNLLKWFQRTCW